MKESLHSRLFSLVVLMMALGAALTGSWSQAVLLMAGLAAHETVKGRVWPRRPAGRHVAAAAANR